MNQFPGTNYHDLNLNWLLGEMKNCLAEWETTKGQWTALAADNAEFKEYVTNYLHNLDITQEISDKIDALVEDGTLLRILTEDEGEGSPLSDTVGEWLAAHIIQETGYVIDDTLTVQGAAADAKAAGDAIADLKSVLETKLGFVNNVDRDLFHAEITTSSPYLTNARRWFVNRIFHQNDKIKTIDFEYWKGSAQTGRIINFEVWTKTGDTLTKVKTVSADVTQETAVQEIGEGSVNVDYTGTGDFMLAVQQEGSPACLLNQTDLTGADNLLVSENVNASTSSLLYSSLETFGVKVIPSFTVNYSEREKVNVVFVGDGMDYEEIQDAINGIADDSATNPYMILVTPKGTPYKPFTTIRANFSASYPWNNVAPRNISIIGMDKDHCIIQSDSGDYYYPCAEPMLNGTIKNLKFIMTIDEQTTTATEGGFCLHIDCRTLNDIGYKMTIEDCDFENASAPCLGVGLHQNCDLSFVRCNFKTTLPANYMPHEGYRNLVDGGFALCHSSTLANAINQHLSFIDCVGSCLEGNKSIQISNAGSYDPETAYFEYTLIRNVFWNYDLNRSGYSISSNITPTPYNYGNNI